MEQIRKLIAAGFTVYLLDINGGGPVEIPKKTEAVDEEKVKVKKKKEFVERILKKVKKKRVNWHTIAKIKELKDDGMTSQEAADELGLDIEIINKHWL